MKVELNIDKNINETKVVIYSKEINEEVMNLMNVIEESNYSESIVGLYNDMNYILNLKDIESFFTENSKVFARKNNQKYQIKKRIFELEELLHNTTFVRISKSEIVNFSKVESLDIQGGTTIILKFKSGEITYVSRRYISKIKKYLKI